MSIGTAICIGLLVFTGMLHTIWLLRIEKKISGDED